MPSTEAALFARIAQPGEDPIESCWLWTGALSADGYGQLSGWGRAHRAVYRILVGEIPDGLEVDHLCEVRNCVNPWHLEPVTHQENVRRRWIRRGDRCAKGLHSMKDAYHPPNGDKRRCHECRKVSARPATAAYRERQKLAA